MWRGAAVGRGDMKCTDVLAYGQADNQLIEACWLLVDAGFFKIYYRLLLLRPEGPHDLLLLLLLLLLVVRHSLLPG